MRQRDPATEPTCWWEGMFDGRVNKWSFADGNTAGQWGRDLRADFRWRWSGKASPRRRHLRRDPAKRGSSQAEGWGTVFLPEGQRGKRSSCGSEIGTSEGPKGGWCGGSLMSEREHGSRGGSPLFRAQHPREGPHPPQQLSSSHPLPPLRSHPSPDVVHSTP